MLGAVAGSWYASFEKAWFAFIDVDGAQHGVPAADVVRNGARPQGSYIRVDERALGLWAMICGDFVDSTRGARAAAWFPKRKGR